MVSSGANSGRGDYAVPPFNPVKVEGKKESGGHHSSSGRRSHPSGRHSSGKHHHRAAEKPEATASYRRGENPSRQMADGGRVKYLSKEQIAKMPGMPMYKWGEEPVNGDWNLERQYVAPEKAPEWHPPPAQPHRSVPIGERIAHRSAKTAAKTAAKVNERIARIRGQHPDPSEMSFACVTSREMERSQNHHSQNRHSGRR